MNSTCELGRHSARALKPYPDYKDSGVQWLGKVPSHWAVRRIRTIASVISGATPSSNTSAYWEGHIVWVTPQDLGALGSRYTTTSARRITGKGYEACGATMAPAGSVAISTRAPIGHTGILSSTACTNQGCRLLVPNGAIQPEHLYYSLKVARPELESLGQGTTFAELSRNELAQFAVPVAPRREQAAIVRFLDHADRRIRRYIRAKQKLITLLQEQKQAVIHRAVTRGLDPNVRLKPSGVEWLGKVPAHWEVLKLRHVLRRHTERERPDLPLLSVVREQGVILRDTTSTDENHNYIPDDLSNYKVVRAGQFAMNKMKAWQGSYGVSCHDGIVSPAYFVFDVLGLEVDFFHAAIRSRAYVPVFTRASDGVRIGQWDLAEVRMREIQFLVPPAAEQAAIVSSLNRATADLDAATTSAQRETSLLREYHTRFIADVVTGKLDVRQAAAQLPDAVEELELVDEADALINGDEELTGALATAPEQAADDD